MSSPSTCSKRCMSLYDSFLPNSPDLPPGRPQQRTTTGTSQRANFSSQLCHGPHAHQPSSLPATWAGPAPPHRAAACTGAPQNPQPKGRAGGAEPTAPRLEGAGGSPRTLQPLLRPSSSPRPRRLGGSFPVPRRKGSRPKTLQIPKRPPGSPNPSNPPAQPVRPCPSPSGSPTPRGKHRRLLPEPGSPRRVSIPIPPPQYRCGAATHRSGGRGGLGLGGGGALGATGGERPRRVGGPGAGGQPGIGAVEAGVSPFPGVGQLGHVPQAEPPHHGPAAGTGTAAGLRALRPGGGGGRGVATREKGAGLRQGGVASRGCGRNEWGGGAMNGRGCSGKGRGLEKGRGLSPALSRAPMGGNGAGGCWGAAACPHPKPSSTPLMVAGRPPPSHQHPPCGATISSKCPRWVLQAPGAPMRTAHMRSWICTQQGLGAAERCRAVEQQVLDTGLVHPTTPQSSSARPENSRRIQGCDNSP